MSNLPRNDALRKNFRRSAGRLGLPCGVCEGAIDYTLQHPDPMSCVVDHIIPLARGGADEHSNLQAAHRSCNRTKSDSLPSDFAPRTFVTTRVW